MTILLPEMSDSMHYFRANLHCHTTVSDGSKSPEQIRHDYMQHGYQIVAFTDHNCFIDHNDFSHDGFLALNGYELDVTEGTDRIENNCRKTCHMCFIAGTPDMDKTVLYHRSLYYNPNYRDRYVFDENEPDFVRVYEPDCINTMFRTAVENGFFCTYNHPTWSKEDYRQYSLYDGMSAMEIVNYGCRIEGYDDDNGHCYTDLLNQHKKIYCIATDDNHNRTDDEHPKCHSYGGYVMIASETLEYVSVMEALKSGRFYSASGNHKILGPEIRSLVFDGNKVRIKTGDAYKIEYMPCTRRNSLVAAPEGESVREAEFTVADDEVWFRLVVTDHRGFKAYTNGYFLEDLR